MYSSADGSIRVWDDRSEPSLVARLQCAEGVESLSVGLNDRVVAAGVGSSLINVQNVMSDDKCFIRMFSQFL